MLKYLVIVLGFIGFLALPVFSEDKPPDNGKAEVSPPGGAPPRTGAREKVESSAYIHYGRMERWKEEDIQITAFTDKVELYHQGKVIKADTMITWSKAESTVIQPSSDPAKNETAFNEVYAEGNIKVISEDDTLLADRFYYNFANDTGMSVNVELRTSGRLEDEQTQPLIIRAKLIYQLDKRTIVAEQATVSTCTNGKPHYYFWVSQVTFLNDEKGKKVILSHIVPHVWGIPFFYFPYYSKMLGEDSLLSALHAERTRRFGLTVQSKWNKSINKYKRDENGEILKDSEGRYKTKRWGDLTLENSYFQKRGMGWEPEIKYRWSAYHGFIRGYYINDKGPEPTPYDSSIYQLYNEPLPTQDQSRRRLHAFHRQELSENLRLDTEVNYLSDRMFLLEFFEREAKEGKTPESYLYLRRSENNSAQTLLGRMRLNDFQTQVEYLPKLNYYLMSQPLKHTPVYGSLNVELSGINAQYDDKTNLPAQELNRIDLLGELASPHQVSFIRVMPFISGRLTGYDKSVQQDNYLDRFIGSGGIRLYSQLQRVFDFQNKPMGLNNIKHTISMETRYSSNYQATVVPADIIAIDEVDRIDKFGEWYFEVRNRFKTRSTPGDENYREFLNIGLALERYPVGRRDTTLFNDSNYLYPMSWIKLAPDSAGQFPQRRTSNINMDMLITPNLPFSLGGRVEYNTMVHKAEVASADFSLVPYTGWSVTLSERYIIDKANALGITLGCSPIDKWQLTVSDQYDFKRDTFTNRIYKLRRDLHEFYLDFGVIVDRGKEETTFTVMLSPKGIFR